MSLNVASTAQLTKLEMSHRGDELRKEDPDYDASLSVTLQCDGPRHLQEAYQILNTQQFKHQVVDNILLIRKIRHVPVVPVMSVAIEYIDAVLLKS